jgi:hypothetical protein
MLSPLCRPSRFLGARTSGCVASCSKLTGSHQRQLQQAKLLAVVDKSCALVDKSRVQNSTTPAMPSSVNCANQFNQCSAKKLLKQAVVPVATVSMTPIPKLPQIVERVMG